MKVALYARVSKADDSQTTKNQLMRLRAFAEHEGHHIFKEYEDFASGADPRRPALEQMMTDARGHKFQALLVVKVDRIARSNIHLYDLLSDLMDRGIKFICVDQPEVSTESSMGKALLGILGVMAELERDLIRERTKAGLARARAEGKVLGRPKLPVKPGRISELKASGRSVPQIAEELGISVRSVQRYAKNELKTPQRKRHTKSVVAEPDDIGVKGRD